jgi:hypothetical protein
MFCNERSTSIHCFLSHSWVKKNISVRNTIEQGCKHSNSDLEFWLVLTEVCKHLWNWIVLLYLNCVKMENKNWRGSCTPWRPMRMYRHSFKIRDLDNWSERNGRLHTLNELRTGEELQCRTGLLRFSRGFLVFDKIWFAFGQNVFQYTEQRMVGCRHRSLSRALINRKSHILYCTNNYHVQQGYITTYVTCYSIRNPLSC